MVITYLHRYVVAHSEAGHRGQRTVGICECSVRSTQH